MCPACLASAAMVAAGATSASGLTLLAVKKIWSGRRPPGAADSRESALETKGDSDGSSEYRIAG